MELTIGERLLLLGMLPKEGDILSLKLIRTLRENLSESLREDQETKHLRRKRADNGEEYWDWQGTDRAAAIELSPKAHALVTEKLTQMNQQKKLTEAHMSLYEKFVTD